MRPLLALTGAALALALSAHAAPLVATSPAALTAALQAAQGGDQIQVSGPMGDVAIGPRVFSPAVDLVNADPGNPATFRTLKLKGVTGLHIQGLTVAFTPDALTKDWSAAVTIDSSADVQLVGGKVTGGPAIAGGLEADLVRAKSDCIIGRPCGYGVNILGGHDVTIQGVEISQFGRGLNFNGPTDLQILGNDIHDTRRTPLVGSGPTRVTIDGNHLHDIHPWRWGQTPLGDHGDLAAFWSNAGQAVPSSGLTFTHNMLDQTSGEPVLGMWIDGTNAAFVDLKVNDNVIAVANWQGILVAQAHDGQIAGNTLIRVQSPNVEAKQAPTILLRAGATNLSVAGNRVSAPISDLSGGQNPRSGTLLLSGAVTGAAAPAIPPPAAPDPRDGQIAALTASLAAANDNLKAALDGAAAAQSKIDAARAALGPSI